jgi:NAD(P)-dependent dehydrogenase (short-subunit alcohol dehydrogenase family)
MGLEGRVAIITGASRGIGFGVAEHLASLGMSVALSDVSPDVRGAAGRLARDGARAHGIVGDVTSKDDVAAMFDRVERELGPVWLLVNNAGVIPTGPTVDMSEEDWDRALAVDLKGVFLCSQAAIRRMIPRGQGRIVNVSSIAGLIVRTGQIAYSSAKAAVNHFTRCLAIEVAPNGITVNAIMPGMTRTEMLVESFHARGLDLDAMLALIPTGRFALPADHAAVVAWFASDASQQVTGQLVAVDGGQSQLMPLRVVPASQGTGAADATEGGRSAKLEVRHVRHDGGNH